MTLNKTSYDDLPYESFPFSYASPEHIRAVGIMFGMNPAQLETARVLELGCASGGNSMCFASNYPKAKIMGIDLSKVQIEDGLNQIKALGLKNIELKAMSIMDIDESFGEFDYIICHGVFSWVPKAVRDKILDISKKNLAQNGIAYISYNTLPGWNCQDSIRGMMQFHSAIFADASNKVEQAKLFLNFVVDALEGSDTPYQRFLKQEAKMAQDYSPSYLLHEYLEGVNDPCYFHDFMKDAISKGLAYLGDTHISTMFTGNLPNNTHEKLQGIQDIVRIEQYMDFINNRKFRSTLLCHDRVQLNRNIQPNVLDKLFISINLVPEKIEQDVDINSSDPLTFYVNGNKEMSISTSSSIMKAVFYSFIENIGLVTNLELIAKVALTKLTKNDLSSVRAEINLNILNLIFKGLARVTSAPLNSTNNISDKPKVSALARHQANDTNATWVTNQASNIVPINIMERLSIPYLDGNHDKLQIVDKLMDKHVANGELTLNQNSNTITDKNIIRSTIETVLNQLLEKLRVNYMLVE